MKGQLEARMAALEDRLRRLDPTFDVNWRATCKDAADLIRDLRRAAFSAKRPAKERNDGV